MRRRLLLPVLALAACGGAPPGAPARSSTLTTDDLKVTLPAGWRAARESLTPNLALPREVIAVGTFDMRYRRTECAHMPGSALEDMPAAGAFVTLFEWPSANRHVPPRPRRFGPRPHDRSEASDCVPRARFRDHWLAFTDHGREFNVLVAFGPRASAATRRQAWHILDTLRIGHATFSIGRPRPDGSLLAPTLHGSAAYRLTVRRNCVVVDAIAARAPWCGAPVYIKRLAGITVVAGIAPQGDVAVNGRRVPLSRDHAFLALTVFRHARVTAAGRRLRPPGTVYDDEIGESILTRTRAQVRHAFGPPAVSRGRCDYYRVVGDDRRRGWRFCFRAGGVMTGASGNVRLPRA